jgi:glycerophosphoryl diester phosphodiesterase
VSEPKIIAEGGAAEERLEDTSGAYQLAIAQGCDFIQANLVPTKDGVLVARREHELSATTDVADRPEFASRRSSKTVDGQSLSGWFSDDFTVAEIKTLTCRERLPDIRPQNVKLDGKAPVLTLSEVLAIARAGCVSTARTIGVCARMLHPGYFSSVGLPLEDRLAQDLANDGYVSPVAAVWVQAFEASALKSFSALSKVRRMQLIDAAGAPADDASRTYADMITPAGLGDIHAYADAVGVNQSLVIDPTAAVFPAPTTLVLDAHNAGLQIYSCTARAENTFLPKALQRGDPTSHGFAGRRGGVDRLLTSLFSLGLDGLSTDVPALAANARAPHRHAPAAGLPEDY